MSDFTTPEGRAELRKLFAHGSSRAIYSWAIVHGPALLDALDKSEGQAHEARVVARNTIAEAALDRVRALCQSTDGEWLDAEFTGNTVGDIRAALDGAQ